MIRSNSLDVGVSAPDGFTETPARPDHELTPLDRVTRRIDHLTHQVDTRNEGKRGSDDLSPTGHRQRVLVVDGRVQYAHQHIAVIWDLLQRYGFDRSHRSGGLAVEQQAARCIGTDQETTAVLYSSGNLRYEMRCR